MFAQHSALIGWLAFYIFITIAIGLYASRRVKNSADFLLAGRSMPIYIVTATVFATWFGSETVLGTSATFMTDGLFGIIADPFGAALCLILVGVFFARKLYRGNFITINDYYRERYSVGIERFTSIAIILSYLGWVAAQLTALGLVFNILSSGSVSLEMGIILGAAIVLVYTLFGGMWSVALTDFMQMIFIVAGLLIITWIITGKIDGGASTVIQHAVDNEKLVLLPDYTWTTILGALGALVTLGFGSIPQQDVFQRVMMAKDESTASKGGIYGGILYLLFAMLPIFLAYCALFIDPAIAEAGLAENGDSQRILPSLILNHTPLFVQVLFFGALLSAIMSTASGTLLAPSSVFSNNLIKPLLKNKSDKENLFMTRVVVFIFSIFVTIFAITKSDIGIFGMVESAYKVTLCGAFIPLVFGLYWSKANTLGAWCSIIAGVSTWLIFETLELDFNDITGWKMLSIPDMHGVVPPQLAGLISAFFGMIFGSLLSREK